MFADYPEYQNPTCDYGFFNDALKELTRWKNELLLVQFLPQDIRKWFIENLIEYFNIQYSHFTDYQKHAVAKMIVADYIGRDDMRRLTCRRVACPWCGNVCPENEMPKMIDAPFKRCGLCDPDRWMRELEQETAAVFASGNYTMKVEYAEVERIENPEATILRHPYDNTRSVAIRHYPDISQEKYIYVWQYYLTAAKPRFKPAWGACFSFREMQESLREALKKITAAATK